MIIVSNLERSAEGFKAPVSVADLARAAYEDAAVRVADKDERVPLFEPKAELHLTFGMLHDYRDVRRQVQRVAKRKQDAAGSELAVAFETLKMANTGGYLLVEDEQYQIVDDAGQAVLLGVGMHQALFPDGREDKTLGVTIQPRNDNEAIIDLFYRVGTLGVMNMGTRVDMWISAGGPSLDDDEDGASDDAMEAALGES